MGIILINIITGLMVDTFSAIRDQEAVRVRTLANDCFVCGLQRHIYEDFALSAQVAIPPPPSPTTTTTTTDGFAF